MSHGRRKLLASLLEDVDELPDVSVVNGSAQGRGSWPSPDHTVAVTQSSFNRIGGAALVM